MSWSKNFVAHSAALVAVTSVAFSPLFSHGSEWQFLDTWDDDSNFLENDIFRSLDFEHLVIMAKAVRINVWEPFGWYMKAIIYALFGLNSYANRVVSLLFHISNIILFYFLLAWLVRKLRSKDGQESARKQFPEGALAGALFFAVHPLAVEVIGWPSANPYTLACFFSLASLLTYTHYVDKQHFFSLALSVLFYVCAVLSKSVALTVPIMVLAIDFATLDPDYLLRSRLQDLCSNFFQYCTERVLFALAVLCAAASTVFANLEGTNPMLDTQKLNGAQRMLKAFCTFGSFFGKVLWPSTLHAHYQVQEWKLNPVEPANDVLLGMALFSMVTFIACIFWRHKPWLLAFWFSFLMTMLPTLGIIQHGMVAMGGDRYMYIPMLTVSAAVGCLYQYFIDEDGVAPDSDEEDTLDEGGRETILGTSSAAYIVLVVRVVAVVWIGVICVITNRQMKTWKNTVSQWTHNIRHDPTDWRAMDQLAEHYVQNKRMTEASEYYDRIEWYSPKIGLKADLHFAKFRVMRGKLMEACLMYGEAEQKYGADAMLYNNLAICALQKDNMKVGLEYLNMALEVATLPKHKSSITANLEELKANWLERENKRYRGQHSLIF